MKKISIMNILTPFIYIFLVYITCAYVWLFLWMGLESFFCNNIIPTLKVCVVSGNSWDDSGFLLTFLFFILPFRLISAIFWFFVLKYFNKLLKK